MVILGRTSCMAILALLLSAGAARAQSRSFESTLEAYLMGASMQGTVGVGPATADVDVPASSVFSNLKFAALADYRGEAPRWAVLADVVYMNLGKAGTTDGGRFSADVGAEEFIGEVDGTWRTSESFEVLGGARYTSLTTTLNSTGPLGTREAKGTKGWFDPVVGAQIFVPFSRAVQLQVRGDIGGFGVGCTFTWQGIVRVNWRVSKLIRVGVGYRVLDQDYESSSGTDRFRWNVVTQGPLVAAGVVF